MVAQLLSASQVDLDTATAVLASCDWNLSVRSPTRGVDTCGAGCNTWLDVRFRLPWTSSPQAVAPRSNQLRVETSAGGARAVVMLVLPARRHLGRLPVVMMGAWARVCIRLRWLGFSADMLCAVFEHRSRHVMSRCSPLVRAPARAATPCDLPHALPHSFCSAAPCDPRENWVDKFSWEYVACCPVS